MSEWMDKDSWKSEKFYNDVKNKFLANEISYEETKKILGIKEEKDPKDFWDRKLTKGKQIFKMPNKIVDRYVFVNGGGSFGCVYVLDDAKVMKLSDFKKYIEGRERWNDITKLSIRYDGFDKRIRFHVWHVLYDGASDFRFYSTTEKRFSLSDCTDDDFYV